MPSASIVSVAARRAAVRRRARCSCRRGTRTGRRPSRPERTTRALRFAVEPSARSPTPPRSPPVREPVVTGRCAAIASPISWRRTSSSVASTAVDRARWPSSVRRPRRGSAAAAGVGRKMFGRLRAGRRGAGGERRELAARRSRRGRCSAPSGRCGRRRRRARRGIAGDGGARLLGRGPQVGGAAEDERRHVRQRAGRASARPRRRASGRTARRARPRSADERGRTARTARAGSRRAAATAWRRRVRRARRVRVHGNGVSSQRVVTNSVVARRGRRARRRVPPAVPVSPRRAPSRRRIGVAVAAQHRAQRARQLGAQRGVQVAGQQDAPERRRVERDAHAAAAAARRRARAAAGARGCAPRGAGRA